MRWPLGSWSRDSQDLFFWDRGQSKEQKETIIAGAHQSDLMCGEANGTRGDEFT